MEQFTYVAGFVVESAWGILPVFVLSVSLGVLVRALRLDGAVRRAFASRVGLAILLATAIGAFSPFCSCTVIPVVAGLLIGGVPLAPVMAFWVASPTMDPEIFALTVGMLGWPLAVSRLVATLVLSLAAGYLTLALTRSGLIGKALRRTVTAERADKCCPAKQRQTPIPVAAGSAPAVSPAREEGFVAAKPDCGTGCNESDGHPEAEGWSISVVAGLRRLSWTEVGRDVARESWRLGRWLLLAFVMEALILAYVPQEAIAGTLGGGNPLAVPLAALIGAPLYLTEVAALPIVSGLLQSGMSPGAAIAFLIAGPTTTVPAMAAVWTLVRPRVFVLYVGIVVVGAVALGIATDVIL
jgi:uncharacterized membrane protein YraQ (UPF0718 family)